MPVIPSSFPPIRTVDDEPPINTPVVTSLDGHWSGESTTSATFRYSLSGGAILESHSLSHELGDQQPSQTEVFGSDTMRLDTALKVTPVLSLPSQSQYDTLETLDLYVSSDPYQGTLGDSFSEAAASDAVFIQGAGSKHSTNNLPKKVVVASVSESVHSHDRESRDRARYQNQSCLCFYTRDWQITRDPRNERTDFLFFCTRYSNFSTNTREQNDGKFSVVAETF
ncbi:hypothetical protein N7513_001873 [Penicillium frequentans]|nr:hypothetical protein N7513_001873 [Penicillium glabrum]